MSESQALPGSSSSMCPGCQGDGSLLLPCGHCLCPACLSLCQRELGKEQTGCTECVSRQLLDGVMKGLLDALFQGQPRRHPPETAEGIEEGGDVCREHGESRNVFCMEDEELICEQCQDEEHQDHECNSLEEATQECKRELREAVWSLQEKLETLKKAKQSCQETTQHVRRQAQNTSRLIKQNFEKLHQFLRDEEISMLRKVSEEEEQKSRKLKERMDSLSEETRTLTEAVDSAEEAMSAPDRDFLKSYKVTSERMSSFCAEHPLELHGSLIDEAKHLGSLRFRVWEKMQNVVSYTPVILDPNTADVCLSLSEDLTSLRFTDEEYSPHPKNPERFLQQQCVLACEGFLSGSNRWDVEVGDCTQWELGVMEMTDSIRTGCLCTLSLSEGVYKTNPPAEAPLKLRRKPQKVRVQVEYEIGRVTFSDATDNSIIYKIKQRFTEKVFPYFSNTCKRHPLQILSEKVSVYTE